MRNEFEKLPEISLRLQDGIIFNGVEYTTHYTLLVHVVDCLNLAWYAFQEQQKVINGMLECMDDAIRLTDEGNSWDAKEVLK